MLHFTGAATHQALWVRQFSAISLMALFFWSNFVSHFTYEEVVSMLQVGRVDMATFTLPGMGLTQLP